MAAQGSYLKGKRTGHWKHHYDSGQVLCEGDYLDGLKVSLWVFYYSNGKMKSRGKYKMDEKHGPWEEWDREGIKSEIDYKEGIKA